MFRLSRFGLSFGLSGALVLTLAASLALSLGRKASAQYPGAAIPTSTEASEFKPGSILFFNLYNSTQGNAAEDTTLALTNTNATTSVLVRLFFVNGTTGLPRNLLVSLGARQTTTVLASQVDPGVRGYVLAVAVDSASYCPIQFNHLMGEAAVKFASGHKANLSAVAVAALSAMPGVCGGNTATVNFDGISYNKLPRMLSLDNVASRADGNDTLIAINRAGGDLTSGIASTTGTLFGVIYDDAETPFSFSLSGAVQVVGSISDSFPRTTPRFSQIVPAGRSGWMKFYNFTTDVALLGAVINFNPGASNPFNGGHNLTHRTLTTTTASYTLPLTAPDLVLSKTHTGAFTFGGTGDYTLIITNNGTDMTAPATPINVTDTLPANLTLASFSGAGWNCTGPGTANVACSINAVLAAGASTAPLTLTVNVNGGTPIGTNSITNTATVSHPQDGNLANNTASDPTTIVCQTITINPATLPNGTLGAAYNQTVTATGGTGALIWSGSAGTLPGGVSLNAASGTLTGMLNALGSFNFTLRATDSNSCFGERAYSVTVGNCPAITISPTILPNGTVGEAYPATQLTATGGTAPYTFSVLSGTLPTGLTLSTAGLLSGTSSTANSFTFTVQAQDAKGCAGTRQYTVTINSISNGLQFFPLPAPVRLLDTRFGASPNACSQPNAPIAGQTSRTQPGRNFCTIPANAQALTGNITTVQSGGGFLTLYPSDAQQPTVASTNYGVNEIINNVFTVGLGADGAFKIFAFNTTDVVVDVTGYYAPPTTGGLYFHPLPKPIRLLETRVGQLGCVTPGVPIQGGDMGTLTQTARLTCDNVTIPPAALAIVGNATTVGPQGPGFLTLFPADATRPLVASSNYNANQIVNGPFTVGLSATGQFKLYTFATTDLVVDVLGYYSSEATDVNGAGLLFTPLAHPVRLLETRAGQPVGCFKPGAPLNGQQEYTQTARGTCDGLTIPANALGVVGNATIVFPAGPGFLTLWPSAATRPLVATSNYNPGDVGNRHFIVGLGNADGAFKMYSFATTELVIDLSGYFAP